MSAPAPIAVVDFATKDISTTYCIDLDTRDRQVAENIARIKGRLSARPEHDGRIAVVCYGPSLEQTWEQLRSFDVIMTCSGAHKFLLDRGLVPTWHCEVDPRAHKADLIGQPHPKVEYLVASVCHHAVLDLLEGYNVKLWHVFANEAQRKNVIFAYPRGEWAITGGSNVGMRALVLARFLGFHKMTVFGMDYSFKNDGTQHAGWHPKESPNVYAVEVAGRFYYTNPPMHQYAQQFFHEIQQLGDIDVEVVGDGLLQAQIREHVKTQPLIHQRKPAMIAATIPPVITPAYAELNRQLHAQDPSYGVSGSKRADVVRKLIASTAALSVLDYGCGKGTLGAALDRPIWEYDPCVAGKDAPPRPADLVICTDVLEHVEPDCLANVLLDIARCTLKVCYAIIHTGPALKSLPDGRNAHLIQWPLERWQAELEKFFAVATITQSGVEITAVLGPKPKEPKSLVAPPLDISKRITPARHDGIEVRFYTPNEQTQWRATSLFTKEPATIAWIDTFEQGDVFWDIGANVGGYSVWAAKRRGVYVRAFEPQAENYALLCRNFALNEIHGDAFCIALSDEKGIGTLHRSSPEAGAACNTFRSSVGPDPKARTSIPQGCVGYRLDDLTYPLLWPDHIKIDVDGLEHRIIMGGKTLLESGRVKSLLVEVNTNLPEHLAMVDYLAGLGYSYDKTQVDQSIRKDGQFKGCAEYVFRRPQSHVGHVVAEVLTTTRRESFPFPWLYVGNVFPAPLYAQMRANLPTDYRPISETRNVEGYPQRFTAQPTDPFWAGVFADLLDGHLKRRLCEFFGVDSAGLTDECLLIRDLPGYSIGPHTDSPAKVITVLFYLPAAFNLIDATGAGTSIYTPKKDGFTCRGGPHYPAADFKRVQTMRFNPNSAFAFLKTDNSFHGVEPCSVTRDVLLYDIRRPS